MAAPSDNALSVSVLTPVDVHAETSVADRRPVVVVATFVVPLHISMPFSSSKNNSDASSVLALLDTKSVRPVVKVSNVSRDRVEVEHLMSGVLRSADSDFVLVATNMSASVQDSSTTHARLNEEWSAS